MKIKINRQMDMLTLPTSSFRLEYEPHGDYFEVSIEESVVINEITSKHIKFILSTAEVLPKNAILSHKTYILAYTNLICFTDIHALLTYKIKPSITFQIKGKDYTFKKMLCYL